MLLNRTPCVIAAWIFLAAGTAGAQSITVQQPVVRQFHVNTVVSVPDRGSLPLGGVSSAQTWGNWRGPSLPASRQFRSAERSTVRAHVFIHDFEVMDRAVLEAADSASAATRVTEPLCGTASSRNPQLSGMALHAHRSLRQRSQQRRDLTGG